MCPRCGKAILETGGHHLIEPYGLVDVLQPVDTQVTKRNPCRQIVRHERTSRLRHQDLAAVRRRTDPSSPMHADTHIPFVACLRLTAVQPHPHPHTHLLGPLVRCQLTLCLDRRRHTLPSRPERAEQRIALRIHHLTAMRRDRRAQHPRLLCQHALVPVPAKPLEQLGGPLHVGEQEGDRAAREPASRGHERFVPRAAG